MKNEDKSKLRSRYHIFILQASDYNDPREIVLHAGEQTDDDWALNPETILSNNDDTHLFVTAADRGRQRVFEVSVNTSKSRNFKSIPVPQEIQHGSVSSVYRYSSSAGDHRLLVSKTSFINSSAFLIVHPATQSSEVISAQTSGDEFGLHRGQISGVWFKGHDDYQVHSWIGKPSYFKEGEKYPLDLLIHGGPHSSWQDLWSPRWNTVLFAEQGYIVVCPDTTGMFFLTYSL